MPEKNYDSDKNYEFKTIEKTEYLEIDIRQADDGEIFLMLQFLPRTDTTKAAAQLNAMYEKIRSAYSDDIQETGAEKTEVSASFVLPRPEYLAADEHLRTIEKLVLDTAKDAAKETEAQSWARKAPGRTSRYAEKPIGSDDTPESMRHGAKFKAQIIKSDPGCN